MAMDVINGGARSQVAELFEFAAELEDQVNHLMNSLEQVQDTLSKLTALYPEGLSYAGLDDAEGKDDKWRRVTRVLGLPL